MFDVIEYTKLDWQELGFFYEFDKENSSWHLRVSRSGLMNMVNFLNIYASKKENEKLGEHDHFGPYMYFTIVTAEDRCITDHGIFGSLVDFKFLSDLLKAKIANSDHGEIICIDSEYSNKNEAVISIEITADDFDPSSADDFSWAKKQ